VGYGYNLVFAKGWLLNFTIIPELGCKVNDSYEREYQFAINNTTKLSLLYNHERYFSGLSCQYDSYWILDGSRVESSIATFNLFVGMRF
ncbi:MAG: DUF4421 family protein, partial [Paludibacteraceae bacterium]